MATGIKESKVALFDIKYELWPNSGYSVLEDGYQDYYIVGVDYELPKAIHDPVYVEYCKQNVDVYLDKTGNKENNWYKKYDSTKLVFSERINSTADECDDLTLYAKWYQAMYRQTNVWKPDQGWGSGNYNLTDWVTLFKWSK